MVLATGLGGFLLSESMVINQIKDWPNKVVCY